MTAFERRACIHSSSNWIPHPTLPQPAGSLTRGTWAARHSLLFADRYEDELDGVTYEDSYELDDEHDLDRAEEELGRGLSEEALRGLHLFRLDEEHGHRVYTGKGSEFARKAVRAELAARR